MPDPPVDPRGVRFAAAVTTAVLVLVLVTGSAWLLAAQVAVFALGAFAGLRFAPYTAAFRLLVAPRSDRRVGHGSTPEVGERCETLRRPDTGSCRRGTGLLRVVGSAASSRRRG